MSNLNISGQIEFESFGGEAKQVLLDFIYPVGSIFQTVSSDFDTVTKVQNHFGGNWEKLSADAYLKIVTSNAGVLGGNSNHKISINQMPSHNHRLLTYTGHTRNSISNNYSPDSGSSNLGKYWGVVGNGSGSGSGTGNYIDNGDDGTQQTAYSPSCGYSNKARYGGVGNNYNTRDIIEAKGGSQAYYPYYYGIYAYRRIP